MADNFGGPNYAGGGSGDHPITTNTMTAAHSAGVVVIGALAFLVAVRMGFRGVSVGHVTGGLVK